MAGVTGLVDLGGGDQFQRVLEVVAMRGEIDGQPVEQVGVPGLGLHGVDRMDDAAAHQAMPEAIDDGAREAAVLGVGHECGELLRRSGCGAVGVDLPSSGKSQPAWAVRPVGLSQRWISSGSSA